MRAVSAETHDDDGDAGDDESEEPGDNGDDATEVGGKKSRSGRHDPAAFDSCTAEEFKLLIECSEGLSTNCAYCNCRLDEATWEQRLVSRDDCPFGTYCRQHDARTQSHGDRTGPCSSTLYNKRT